MINLSQNPLDKPPFRVFGFFFFNKLRIGVSFLLIQIATANGHTAVEKELRKFLKVRKSRDTAGGTTLLS